MLCRFIIITSLPSHRYCPIAPVILLPLTYCLIQPRSLNLLDASCTLYTPLIRYALAINASYARVATSASGLNLSSWRPLTLRFRMTCTAGLEHKDCANLCTALMLTFDTAVNQERDTDKDILRLRLRLRRHGCVSARKLKLIQQPECAPMRYSLSCIQTLCRSGRIANSCA